MLLANPNCFRNERHQVKKARTPVPLLYQNIDCKHPSPTYQDMTLERMETAHVTNNVQSWVHAVCGNNSSSPNVCITAKRKPLQEISSDYSGLWFEILVSPLKTDPASGSEIPVTKVRGWAPCLLSVSPLGFIVSVDNHEKNLGNIV